MTLIWIRYRRSQGIDYKCLAALGADYHGVIQKAFDERWMVFTPHPAKGSGAYLLFFYDVHPYIL
jgi:oligoendopeptidase F